eukprot:g3692.t1
MEQLQAALAATISPNKQERQGAERYLKDLRTTPGQIGVLLHVVAQRETASRAMRQSAGIALKNVIRDHWDARDSDKEGDAPIPGIFEQDRQVLRENLVEVLSLETDNSVRNLLAEANYHITRWTYHCEPSPDAEPAARAACFAAVAARVQAEVLPGLMQHLGSGDQLRMFNAVTAARAVVKVYEHKSAEARAPLEPIVQQLFPVLLQLYQGALQFNTIEAGQMLTLIGKVFWHVTQFSLPDCMAAQPSAMLPWFEAFAAIMRKPLPEASEGGEPAGQPVDPEEREKWPWWKAKKRALQISARFFERFGRKQYVEKKYAPFADFFLHNISCIVLEQVMQLVALPSQGRYCTTKVQHASLMYLETSVQMSLTYKLIKPHLDVLVRQVIFPIICLQPKDLELWESDPHEYVRRSGDIEYEFLSPVTMALNLLETLCSKRGKDALARSLNFFTEKLTAYQLAAPAQREYVHQDAVIFAIGALENVLKKSNKFAPNIEVMLVSHVLPELRSQHGFLRARALWCVGRFADVEFKVPQNVLGFTEGVIEALRDAELPVQAAAATALKKLLEEQEATAQVVKSRLPQVIQEYFRMMQDLGNDDVVDGLNACLEKFPDDIGPMAEQISQILVQSFFNYAAEGDDDDEAEMAAIRTLDAMTTVLDACSSKPEYLPGVERQLLPVVAKILHPSGDAIEYIETACEI